MVNAVAMICPARDVEIVALNEPVTAGSSASNTLRAIAADSCLCQCQVLCRFPEPALSAARRRQDPRRFRPFPAIADQIGCQRLDP